MPYQPRLPRNQPSKSMIEKFNPFINLSATRTVPSTGTESVGLAANAHGVMVFARHLDSFIVTRNFRSYTGTLQKRMPTQTLTATHETAGPSDCLITKMKSLRIEYLKFFVYRYPNKRLYKIGY